MIIREYNAASDFDGLRNCVIELQNYEYDLDSRFPDGQSIVDAYIPDILRRCEEYRGTILVADVDQQVAGYSMVFTRVTSEDIEDGDFECGYLADLVVLPGYRQQGIGAELLSASEDYARERGVTWFRIGVMAANTKARDLYIASGYSPFSMKLEKRL